MKAVIPSLLLIGFFACSRQPSAIPPREEHRFSTNPFTMRSYAGCYEVLVPLAFKARIDPFPGPLLRAELVPKKSSRPFTFIAHVTPAPRLEADWTISDGKAAFGWSSGFSGLVVTLDNRSGSVVALAQWWTDSQPDQVAVPVPVRRMSCPNSRRGDA